MTWDVSKNLKARMKQEVRNNLLQYLDDSRCFNCTGLAECFLAEDDIEEGSEAEEEYFEAAFQVERWAVKQYNLNED